MAIASLQKFLSQLSKNKNVQKTVNELTKISDDLNKRGTELSKRFTAGKEKTLKQARDGYHQMLKAVGTSQTQLDKEMNKALGKIRSAATEVEKNLEYYRKKALDQKERVEKMMMSTQQATKKKASKKVSKKVSKKTTKKASRK